MKTPIQELIEWMEQNQYFIGNDLYAKQKELLEKHYANQQPEVDYQKMFANCKLPNEQPTKTVEERAFETGIRESANANDEFGYEAWFKVGVQTFSVSYIGTKEEAEAHRNMLETALTNIKGATDNQNK